MTEGHRHRTTTCFAALTAMAALCLGCGGTTSTSSESSVEWIDADDIQHGPIIHNTLSDDLLTRIKAVHETFADVDGTPLEEWIDDFKRDPDPVGNVGIWEDMQLAYSSYCKDRELPLETRKEVFKIVLMRSMMPDADVLARLELEHLPVDDVPTILDAYPGDAKPIEVFQTGE